MDSDTLINRINSIPAISAAGLKNTPFPDEVIASLHNHLGNCKHYISDIVYAFNGAEQYISIRSAAGELSEAGNDLFKLHAKLVFSDVEYDAVNRIVHEVDEQLRRATDAEYED